MHAALIGLAAAAAAGVPQQTTAFTPCASAPHVQCAQVSVPLDRSGDVPGTIALHVERVRAASRSRTAVLALAGGPGEAATARTAAFARELAPALRTRDLIVFDQRGTGRSGRLTCTDPRDGARCAAEIGAGVHLYTTRDSVQDIEAVRQLAGVDRLVLYGVSYGTKVALAYAKRYPARVESLVLDSVVDLDGFDFLQLDVYRDAGRVLRGICTANACVEALATLSRQAATTTLFAPYVLPDGRIGRVRVLPHTLFAAVVGASRDAVVRARLPAAIVAAARGDGAPLGRLLDAVGETHGTGDTSFSEALFRATVCEELPPLWWRTASLGDRVQGIKQTLQARAADAFYPFDASSAADGATVADCLMWPVAPAPPVLGGTGPPDVRVLVLAGTDDLVTPPAGARAAAARFRRATVLEVPDMGHAVLANAGSSNGGPCARRALVAFFSGAAIRSCSAVRPRIAATPVPPARFDELTPWRGMSGDRGRLATAVVATLADVRLTACNEAASRVGLRGGTFTLESGAFELDGVEYVPGVVVSGRYRPAKRTASMTVQWPGGSDTVQLSAAVVQTVSPCAAP